MIEVTNTTPGYTKPPVTDLAVEVKVQHRPEPLMRMYQEFASGTKDGFEFVLRLDFGGGLDLVVNGPGFKNDSYYITASSL